MSPIEIVTVPMEHVDTDGALRPEPATLDVRASLIPHATGMVIDTGMDPAGVALAACLRTDRRRPIAGGVGCEAGRTLVPTMS